MTRWSNDFIRMAYAVGTFLLGIGGIPVRFQGVFIDRDGTIGGDGHFTHPRHFVPYSFSICAINLLKEKGLKVFAFTNQHRIADGQATVEDFLWEFEKLGFHDAYVCPHENDSGCECHKPSPGLLLRASRQYDLDLTKCAVIGDMGTDMVAADAVGCTKILVRTGFGEGSLTDYRYLWTGIEPDYIAANLLDAAKWVLEKHQLSEA